MGKEPTKAAANIYCICRKEAAKRNDRLNSREGASEQLGISVSTLADYELGITKVVPVDKVVLMADLYNAPELRNWYCRNECPLGFDCVPTLEVAELDRLTLKVLNSFRNVANIKDTLIDIAADGVITTEEKPKLDDVLKSLEAISTYAQELRLWAEKNIK